MGAEHEETELQNSNMNIIVNNQNFNTDGELYSTEIFQNNMIN